MSNCKECIFYGEFDNMNSHTPICTVAPFELEFATKVIYKIKDCPFKLIKTKEHVFEEFNIYSHKGIDMVYCTTNCNGHTIELQLPLDYLNYCPICGNKIHIK